MAADIPPWWLIDSDAFSQKVSQTVRSVTTPRKWRSIRTSPVGLRMKSDCIMAYRLVVLVVYLFCSGMASLSSSCLVLCSARCVPHCHSLVTCHCHLPPLCCQKRIRIKVMYLLPPALVRPSSVFSTWELHRIFPFYKLSSVSLHLDLIFSNFEHNNLTSNITNNTANFGF